MTVQDSTGDDQNKSIEDLKKELAELRTKYENTDQANVKLRADLAEAKANSGDVAALQKQHDKLLTEKSKLQASFDEYKKEVQTNTLKQHLTTALEAAGAHNPSTPMKLIDMSAITFDENGQVVQTSVADAINAVKTSDPYLFKEQAADPKGQTTNSTPTTSGPLPAVKHAADRLTDSGFKTELAAAELTGNLEAIEAVMAKYHAKA